MNSKQKKRGEWQLAGIYLMIISGLNAYSVYSRRLMFGVYLGGVRQGVVTENLISPDEVPYHLIAMGILFVIGFTLLIFNLKKKEQDNEFEIRTDFICPSCEHPELNLSTLKAHICPKCGKKMVKLKGFYDGRGD